MIITNNDVTRLADVLKVPVFTLLLSINKTKSIANLIKAINNLFYV
jgi:hypothetical protein